MLLEINIRNFATIESLSVAFGPGFNVLTGETGAGKSIIIDAVGLLIGERARPDLIRSGEEEATVEALLDISGHAPLQAELQANGFAAGDELLVKRTIARNGKNRVYLNGSLATLAQLQPFTSRLLTIYGQHEHQSLLQSDTHLPFLDTFAGLDDEVHAYRAIYDEVQRLSAHLQQLEESDRQRQQRMDLLTFQRDEIAAAAFGPAEDEELTAERLLLQHAERLTAATAGGYEALYGAEGAICEQLGKIAAELNELTKIDPRLGPLAEILGSSLYALEDVAAQLRAFADRMQYDPHRLSEIDERLALLGTLKRKYGATLEDVARHQQQAIAELDQLVHLSESLVDLRNNIAVQQQRLTSAASALSEKRRSAARVLQNAVEAELHDLAMPRARLEVRFVPLANPGARGLERGEFFLAPNPGEEPKPLARIASGGELSRVMLALKRAAPESDKVATLVFDEVDAGIGGKAASSVGEKLRQAAAGLQVLCITHLPQVAAFAERHYRVDKEQRDGRTFTRLQLLDDNDRVEEMARMLGGAQVTARTLEHARELIGLPLAHRSAQVEQ